MKNIKLNNYSSYVRLFIMCQIFSFLLSSCSDNNITIGQSPLLRFIEPKSGKIVFMSSDGNIYTADQTGGDLVPITTDAELNNSTNNQIQYYQFPTWAPNGSRVAYVGLENQLQQEPRYSLFTSNSDGSNKTKIFSSTKYLPRNIYWSSDSQKITFLTSEIGNSASALQIASVTGSDENNRIDAGTPFYWSWSPNNKTIVVHIPPSTIQAYSRLAFLNLDGTFYEESFPFKAGMFQSPAWSPDGNQILVAAFSETQSDLILTDQNSSLYQKIHSSKGSLLFSWSPDGTHIAYIERLTEQDQATSFLSLVKTTPTDSKISKLIDDKYVLAFFWSPDNSRIAFFVPSMLANSEDPEQQTLVLTLFMYNLKKNTSREINTFVPTAQFLAVIQQFDHYYQTSRLWSPDSRNILYSALTENGPKILIAKAEGNIAPRQVIDGYLGFWSWD